VKNKFIGNIMAKRYKVKPTKMQKQAIENSIKNGGNMSKAMLEAGYSLTTARTPQRLTDSRAWEILMDDYLPDDFLLKALEDDIKNKPQNRKAELELALKLKGKTKERIDITSDDQRIEGINYIVPKMTDVKVVKPKK
jgi:hypothetical protein